MARSMSNNDRDCRDFDSVVTAQTTSAPSAASKSHHYAADGRPLETKVPRSAHSGSATMYSMTQSTPPSNSSGTVYLQAYDNRVFSMAHPVAESSKHQPDASPPYRVDQGRQDNQGEKGRKQEKRMRRRTIAIAIVLVLLVLAVAIALAVYFAVIAKDSTPQSACTADKHRDGSFNGSLKMTIQWDPSMADVSSEAWQDTTHKITATMKEVYRASNASQIVKDVCVQSLRRGSVVVNFLLFLHEPQELSDPEAISQLQTAKSQPQTLRDAFRQGLSLLKTNGGSQNFVHDIDESTYDIQPIITSPTTTLSPNPTTETTTTRIASSTATTPSSTTPTSTPETATSAEERPRAACGMAQPRPSARIIGGRESIRGAYPWIVLLFINDEPMCGGSIMDDTHIITAVHCLEDVVIDEGQDRLDIVAGSHLVNYSTLDHVQKVAVSSFHNHAQYDINSNFNDIAVLRLSRPLTFDSFVSPVCLPDASSTLPSRCTVAGWGSTTSPKDTFPDELREVTLWAYNSSQCRATFPDFMSANEDIDFYLDDGVMCAANGINGGLDSCLGDSGGPLFCPEVDQQTGQTRYTQYGVVSWGEGCGVAGNPGFYAYLPYFRTWLDDVAIPALAKT